MSDREYAYYRRFLSVAIEERVSLKQKFSALPADIREDEEFARFLSSYAGLTRLIEGTHAILIGWASR